MSLYQSPVPELPSLADLGTDLLRTSARQRTLALLRPFAGILIYAAAMAIGWWWITPVIVFLIFVSVVTVTHDIVHGSLDLSPRQTEWWLFISGAVLLESGHAYRHSHLQHHAVFPGADDPEGDPARMTFWQAVRHGPTFLPRLWWWAWRRQRGPARRWLLAEAAWALAIPICGVLLWPSTAALLWFAVQCIIGSWVYPLLTVYLPHHHYGESPLTQTRTLRGTIIPKLFLELTYHLEHHLYPRVPSHNLPELARRLKPYFEAAGVKAISVP